MKTTQSLLSPITQERYLASLDLKDAYYFVPIHLDHIKFLKSLALPNDLCCGQKQLQN